jgi:hypothetical protein
LEIYASLDQGVSDAEEDDIGYPEDEGEVLDGWEMAADAL